MGFKKIDTTARPPRHWALVGHPGSGKSTFAAVMDAPLLVVDAAPHNADGYPPGGFVQAVCGAA